MGCFSKIFTWWDGATIGTSLFSAMNGERVGIEAAGNTYFRAKKKLADGRERRWVIYNGANDASRVPPEWHGWLHHTWNEAPTELAVPRKAWEQPHQANLTGTPGAYVPAGSLYRAAPAVRSDYDAWRPE